MTVTLTQGGIVSGGAAPATSGAGRRTDALPAPSVELSIIVLNYRTPRLLEQCLHGILGLRTALGPEVIVVDNGSADGSLEMVAERFPQVTHIASPVNLGYAAGNNLALRRSRGRCVLVMNTDVVLPEGALDELCRYLSEHPSAGLVAPRLVNPDGTTQLSVARFPSFWMPLWRRTPLGYLPLPRRAAARYMMTDWDHRDSRTVGWAMGACLWISAGGCGRRAGRSTTTPRSRWSTCTGGCRRAARRSSRCSRAPWPGRTCAAGCGTSPSTAAPPGPPTACERSFLTGAGRDCARILAGRRMADRVIVLYAASSSAPGRPEAAPIGVAGCS